MSKLWRAIALICATVYVTARNINPMQSDFSDDQVIQIARKFERHIVTEPK